jgi:hypothetical protein
MTLAAIYEDSKKQQHQIPITEERGRPFLVSESGALAELENILEDKYLGTLTYVDTIEVPTPLPRPINHELRAAVAKFKTVYNSSFRSKDEEIAFINAHKEIRDAYDDDFKNTTIAQLGEWARLVKTSVRAEEFSQEERRIKFTGQRIGPHLYIGAEKVPSCAANEWNGEFAVECHGCRTLKGATITQLGILKMRAGLAPMFECQRPCMKS